MINKIYTPTKAERIDLMKKFIKKNPSITWVDLKRAVQTKDYPDNRFNSDIASLSLLLKREGFYLKIEPKIGKRKDRKSTRLNSSHRSLSRMPSSA